MPSAVTFVERYSSCKTVCDGAVRFCTALFYIQLLVKIKYNSKKLNTIQKEKEND